MSGMTLEQMKKKIEEMYTEIGFPDDYPNGERITPWKIKNGMIRYINDLITKPPGFRDEINYIYDGSGGSINLYHELKDAVRYLNKYEKKADKIKKLDALVEKFSDFASDTIAEQIGREYFGAMRAGLETRDYGDPAIIDKYLRPVGDLNHFIESTELIHEQGLIKALSNLWNVNNDTNYLKLQQVLQPAMQKLIENGKIEEKTKKTINEKLSIIAEKAGYSPLVKGREQETKVGSLARNIENKGKINERLNGDPQIGGSADSLQKRLEELRVNHVNDTPLDGRVSRLEERLRALNESSEEKNQLSLEKRFEKLQGKEPNSQGKKVSPIMIRNFSTNNLPRTNEKQQPILTTDLQRCARMLAKFPVGSKFTDALKLINKIEENLLKGLYKNLDANAAKSNIEKLARNLTNEINSLTRQLETSRSSSQAEGNNKQQKIKDMQSMLQTLYEFDGILRRIQAVTNKSSAQDTPDSNLPPRFPKI